MIINMVVLATALPCFFVSCRKSLPEHDSLRNRSAFTDDIRLKTTPVLHQGKSSACWAYAMCATIESIRLEMGDSVTLSPSFLQYHWVTDQALRSYMCQGTTPISQQAIATEALYIAEKHGAMPLEAFNKAHISPAVMRQVRSYVATAVKQRLGLDDVAENVERLLGDSVGYPAKCCFFYGAEYSPQTYARSMNATPSDFCTLMSDDRYPYNNMCDLNIPDNTCLRQAYNLPADSLIDVIVNSLKARMAVCWEGDVTEKGYSFAKGIAIIDKDASDITDADRSRMLQRFQTTDDHAMSIIGMAHSKSGERFFILKDSHGTANAYGGYIYMSEAYLKAKTILLVVDKSVMRKS